MIHIHCERCDSLLLYKSIYLILTAPNTIFFIYIRNYSYFVVHGIVGILPYKRIVRPQTVVYLLSDKWKQNEKQNKTNILIHYEWWSFARSFVRFTIKFQFRIIASKWYFKANRSLSSYLRYNEHRIIYTHYTQTPNIYM